MIQLEWEHDDAKLRNLKMEFSFHLKWIREVVLLVTGNGRCWDYFQEVCVELLSDLGSILLEEVVELWALVWNWGPIALDGEVPLGIKDELDGQRKLGCTQWSEGNIMSKLIGLKRLRFLWSLHWEVFHGRCNHGYGSLCSLHWIPKGLRKCSHIRDEHT